MNKPYFNTENKEPINWWTNYNYAHLNKILFIKKVPNFKEIEPSEEGCYELMINEIVLNKKNPYKHIAKLIIAEKRFVARVWFTITLLITLSLLAIIFLK